MNLLQTLGLKPPPAAMLRKFPAAAASEVKLPPGAAVPGAATAAMAPGAVPIDGGAAGSPTRAAAQALVEPLRGREQALHAQLGDARRRALALETALENASAADKAALAAKKKMADAEAARLEKQLHGVRDDLGTLTQSDARAAALAAAMGRHGAAGSIHEVAVDETAGRFGNRSTTRTESSVADGQATIARRQDSRVVGLGGVETRSERSTGQIGADGRSQVTRVESSKLGKDGFAFHRDETVRVEDEHGEGSSVSRQTAVTLGGSGVSRSDTVATTQADGSGTSRTVGAGLERGKGRLGASRSEKTTRTGADGTTVTESRGAKGGVIADGKGLGAYGEAETSVERATKSGLKTGVQATGSANVYCTVEPAGTKPESYYVKLTVDLGMKVGGTLGFGKKGGPGVKGGANASGKVWMNQTWGPLSAQDAQSQLGLIQGGGAGGSSKELQVLRALKERGVDAARDLFLGHASSDPGEGLDQPGSREVGEQLTKGFSGSLAVNAGGIDVEAGGGVDLSHSHSLKATRDAQGRTSYDGKASDGTTIKGHVKAGVAGVKMGVGAQWTDSRATGYVFDEPQTPQQRAALAACRTQAEFDAYAQQYGFVKKVKTDTKAQTANVSLEAPGDTRLTMEGGHGLERARTFGSDGRLQSEQVTGQNGAGVTLEIAGQKLGSSRKEEAVAQIDADGHATLDVRRTVTGTDADRFAAAKLPGGAKKPADQGLLARAAGAPDTADTDSRNLQGMQVREADLSRLGAIAVHDWGRWMAACPSTARRADWARAGATIRKAGGKPGPVADAMAVFVGADATSRGHVINQALRDPGDVAAGMRYEFPDGLASQKSAYDRLVVASCETAVREAKEPQAAEAAGRALMAELDALQVKISSASGFQQPAVQAEMLASISRRQQQVENAMREAAVGGAGPADARAARYRRVLGVCVRHKSIENDVYLRLEQLFSAKQYRAETMESATLVKQLRDLIAVWQPSWEELQLLAEECGRQDDPFWKYQPDLARFARVQQGAPGRASTLEKPAAGAHKPVKVAEADPVGASGRASDVQRSAQARQIAVDLKTLAPQAAGASKKLLALLKEQPLPMATHAHNLGRPKLMSAMENLRKCASNDDGDLETWGYQAANDFRAALAEFRKGIALFARRA